MMPANKTVANDKSVDEYISHIADEGRKNDTIELIKLVQKQTGFPPKMWGTSIVGFGSYHYKYESGREGDAPLVGLSARANAIVFYLPVFDGREQLLQQLGKYKTGKGCIYIQKMKDVNADVLSHIVSQSVIYRRNEHSG